MKKIILIKQILQNSNFIATLVCIGLSWTLFTRFRPQGIPIGLGEVILLFTGAICSYLIIKQRYYKEIFKDSFVLFWIVSFMLLFIGLILNINEEFYINIKFIIYDLLAYGFVFLNLIIFFYLNKTSSIKNIIEKLIIINLFFYIFLICINFFADFQFYNRGFRYIGLSKNPNQLALLFTVFLFVIMHLKKEHKYINVLYIVLTLFVIYQIKSNALFVGVLSGIFFYIFLKNLERIKYKKVLIISTFLLVILLLMFVYYDYVNDHYLFSRKDIIDRITLYQNAFSSISTSMFFGLGPGPHSFLTSEVTGNVDIYEAHNIYIDWLTQTGITGLSLFVYLLFKIIKKLYQKKDFVLLGGLGALLAFSFFHFTLRQPVFWFYLYSFYALAQREYKSFEIDNDK